MSWFESVAELAQSVCGAVTIELVVQGQNPLTLRWPESAPATNFRTAEWITPHVVDPAQHASTARPIADWVGSAAVVPITNPSADIGWFLVAHERTDAFTTESLEQLTRFATMIEMYLDDQLVTSELDKLSEQLRKSERQLTQTQAQLEVSNQELEQFAYIAAHELVAPLRSVAVYAEVMATITSEHRDELPQLRACVAEIRSGVQRMTEQVQYLLTLSRAQQAQGKLELVDTTLTAFGAVDTLTELLEDADATVTINELPAVMAHYIPLQSVFANLITNAVRYREPTRPLEVLIQVRHHDDGIDIEVVDNASGISHEARERVFGLFERGSTNGDGLGVGLAVSRRILEGFGASISVSSSDTGSSFVLHFPVPSAPPDSSTPL